MKRSVSLFCPTTAWKPSDLIRAENHKQHVFKWGVGNKFRSLNRNRLVPVHHARPKEVTIPTDYFVSPHPQFIKYDPLNEAWEVFWEENMKLNAKPFPVKKFGVEESKIEAEKWFKEVSSRQRPSSMTNSSPENNPNVFWDNRMQAWFSLDTSDPGRPVSVKAFSAIKHGHARARELAEQKSKSLNPRVLNNIKQAILKISAHQKEP